MRPGVPTRQYKDPNPQTGAYWQISYTRQMKSRTEYVRQECVKEPRRRIGTLKWESRVQNARLPCHNKTLSINRGRSESS